MHFQLGTNEEVNEAAMEGSGGGLFTSNIRDALQGGAADVRGSVTIAATYAYVNEVFTHLEQKPLFRASLARVTSLRTAAPSISDHNIRRLPELFPDVNGEYSLSRAYEPTAEPNDPEKEGIFSVLQQMRAARLVDRRDFDQYKSVPMGSLGDRSRH